MVIVDLESFTVFPGIFSPRFVPPFAYTAISDLPLVLLESHAYVPCFSCQFRRFRAAGTSSPTDSAGLPRSLIPPLFTRIDEFPTRSTCTVFSSFPPFRFPQTPYPPTFIYAASSPLGYHLSLSHFPFFLSLLMSLI